MLIRSGIFIILTVNFIQGDPIFPNATSLNRFRRQTSSCRINEFKCKNGKCISEDMLCDGLEQCSDGSDETTDCRAISCAPFLFRCSYGACINEDLVCDGRKDCKDNSDETAPKCKGIKPAVVNACGANKFQCTNGECIDDLDICDGVATCKDGSDETQVACGSIPCPGFAFRCAYGGCVNNDARCNGVIECQDGSDEKGCPTGTGTVTTSTTRRTPVSPPDSNSCILPEQIKNGIYQTGGDLQNKQPGDFVASSSSITFKCKPGFKFDQYEATTIYCITGKWHTTFPICKQYCEPLTAANMQVTCMDSKFSRVDCDYAFSGTRATIKCNPLYENQQSDPNRFCRDGSWNSAPPVCTPVCGQKSINAQELAVNAQATVKGEYPWQAIIYHNRIQICGGTVISPKLTITAAHCFKNQGGKYEVAAGKYFRQYLDDGDKNAQYSDIKIAEIPSDYQAGVQNYQFDIAVLVLDQPFKLTEFVQPVCIDWESRFEREQLVANSYGVVSGWGYTKSGEAPSEELKKITVPYIPRDQCLKKLPEDNDRLVTSDKFCAGYTNGTSVCQGDSGGGLIFRRPSDRRYYLRGIVSIAPRLVETGSCDPNTYALYTLVSKHLDYVTGVRGVHGD